MKRKHHDCALVRIAALEAELARAIDELRQAVAMRDVFAKALVVSVDKTDKLQGHPVDKSPDLQVPNDDMVICPNCVLQFRAIPVNVQHEIAAERKRREDAEIALQEILGFSDHIVEAEEIAMQHLERFRKD